MAAALRLLRIPFVVLVHDADAHPGNGFPMQMSLQRQLCRRAMTVAALSTHVGEQLLRQKLAGMLGRPLIRLTHPPMPYEVRPRPADAGEGFRLLSFGRLLPYEGLDMLVDGLRRLGPAPGRVVGPSPESAALAALRALPGVTVENRWVPEDEVGTLLGWADAVVLPYREASQTGAAAVALAAGRYGIATNVGGLAEQLRGGALAILCEPHADSLADGVRRVTKPARRGRRPDQPTGRVAGSGADARGPPARAAGLQRGAEIERPFCPPHCCRLVGVTMGERRSQWRAAAVLGAAPMSPLSPSIRS